MISLKNCTIKAGDFVLEDINLEIQAGSYGILMGKTGSGKTTILEAICGLRKVSSGIIKINDVDVTHKRPAERNIGFLPQDIALFDHMTVRQHLAFGMLIQKFDKKMVAKRVSELAEKLQLLRLLDRKPAGLSGGEKQRTALGRALAVKPKVLCLDEPLSTLDEDTHEEMISLIKRVVIEDQITVFHITHSKLEAKLLGQHFYSIKAGMIKKS